MAKLLWAKVFYKEQLAGYLRQEPGERYSFVYHESYLNSKNPPIAHTLPLTEKVVVTEQFLPAFFDNLAAEGWMEEAQRRLLGKRTCSRFELLLGFGIDCAGAVSIVDPEAPPLYLEKLGADDPKNVAIFKNRASLSGIQPKVLLVEEKGQLRLAHHGEISTHIAKLSSEAINDIVYNEWITLCACKALLPEDSIVEAKLDRFDGLGDEILIVKRFDRTNGKEKIHFEEFNSLLNHQTFEKYDGSYRAMADFVYKTENCLPSEIYRLYKRILVGLLLGNTDMHFKNFALMYTAEGLRLTPNYDQVAAAIYKPYQTIALTLDKEADRLITQLKPKNLIALGREFSLKDGAIFLAVAELEKRLPDVKDAIQKCCNGQTIMKKNIINFMEKRWKGSFSSIGKLLSKRL
ncbi:MAG: HipA domain-containing protein [Proteobacteria bacterium]|nr:HipA domain-containing protein [Pseudomonadota bacterium]